MPQRYAEADSHLEAFPEAQQAARLVESKNFKTAAGLLERVVEVAEAATGRESDMTFAALQRLSAVLLQCERYEHARGVIQRMLQCVQHSPDATTKGVKLAVLEQVYRLHLHLGAPSKAKALCDTAEDVATGLGDYTGVVASQSAKDLASIMAGEPRPDSFLTALNTASQHDCSRVAHAGVWRNRGVILFGMRHTAEQDFMGCFDEALGLLEKAASIVDSGEEKCRIIQLERAAVLTAKGYCATQMQEFGVAGKELTKALHIYEDLLPPTHPSLARVLMVLGLLKHATQKAVTAEGLLKSAIEKFEAAKLLPYQRRDYKASLFMLSSLFDQWDRREADSARALALAKSVQVFPPCAFAESLMPLFPYLAAGRDGNAASLAEMELCSAPSSLYALGSLQLELQHVHCSKCSARPS